MKCARVKERRRRAEIQFRKHANRGVALNLISNSLSVKGRQTGVPAVERNYVGKTYIESIHF